jgi:hypothetical protein
VGEDSETRTPKRLVRKSIAPVPTLALVQVTEQALFAAISYPDAENRQRRQELTCD